MTCWRIPKVLAAPDTATHHCDTVRSAIETTQTYSGMALVDGANSNPAISSGGIVQTGQQALTQNIMTSEPIDPGVGNVQVVEACGMLLTYKPILSSHGWVTVGNDSNNLPYLMRNGERFIPLSVIENVYLSKYQELYPEKLGRQPMKGFYMTTEEVRLLNRFVTQSYTQRLGLARFSLKDMLVAVYDFVDFYHRLQKVSIRHEVDQPLPAEEDKPLVLGGWSQVNNTVIPYVTRNKVKMVPLSVVRYAAGLLCDLDVPSLDVNEEECRYLNQACVDEGLDFQFHLNTKLIELFLIPTLSKSRVSIQDLPQKDPMQHAKFINRCTDRRSVFVAASVRKSGSVRRRSQRRHSNKQISSAVAGVSTASLVQSLATQHQLSPTTGQWCQIPSLSVTCIKEAQRVMQETNPCPPTNVASVMPTPDSVQQELAFLPEPGVYPHMTSPITSDSSNVSVPQPEFTTCQVNQMTSNPSPSLQPNYAAEDGAGLSPTNAVPAVLPIMPETSTLQVPASPMSTATSIMTGLNGVEVTAPLFMISEATPTTTPTTLAVSLTSPMMPLQRPAMPAAPIPAPLPDVSEYKSIMSTSNGNIPELTPVIPELPISPDIIKIELNDDDENEEDGNCDQRRGDTITNLGPTEHENNLNQTFYSSTDINTRLESYGIRKRQVNIVEENGPLFGIKQRKLAEHGILWTSINNDRLWITD